MSEHHLISSMQLTLAYDGKKDLLFEMAQKHHGNLKLIADKCNLTVRQVQWMYKNRKEFQEVVNTAREALYESAEEKLIQKIEDGSMNAMQLFFTKSPQAKERGWGERSEVQSVNLNLTDLEKATAAKQMLGIEDSDKPNV